MLLFSCRQVSKHIILKLKKNIMAITVVLNPEQIHLNKYMFGANQIHLKLLVFKSNIFQY